MICNADGPITVTTWEIVSEIDGSIALFLLSSRGKCILRPNSPTGIEWSMTREQALRLSADLAAVASSESDSCEMVAA